MTPKLSIIVPIYNTEKYLERCIESILNQTYTDFELILVDDGSMDSSWSVCVAYHQKDDRIRIFRKENEGLSATRNYGINVAKGSFVGFVDSDDWIDKDMYKILMQGIEEYTADMSVCNFYVFEKNGEKHMFHGQKISCLYSHDDGMKEIAKNNKISYTACNKVYHKSLFEEDRFMEGIIYEDMDLMYRVVDKCKKIAYIGEPLYNYCYNQGSILHSAYSLKQLEGYEVLKRKYMYYKEKYPQWSYDVYAEKVVMGFDMYSHIKLYYKEVYKKYSYLIRHNDISKIQLLKKCDLKAIEKLRLFLFLYVPNLSSLWRMGRIRIENEK